MEDESTSHDRGSESDVEGERSSIPEVVLVLDHVFEALAHPRRRYLLYTLLEDTRWSLWELATKIAAWEHDVPGETVRDAQRNQVYVSLYHTHVPKLVNDGILEFDEVGEEITPGEHAAQVLAALEGAGASIDSLQETHARSDYNE